LIAASWPVATCSALAEVRMSAAEAIAAKAAPIIKLRFIARLL
jgi:hypothetical protein